MLHRKLSDSGTWDICLDVGDVLNLDAADYRIFTASIKLQVDFASGRSGRIKVDWKGKIYDRSKSDLHQLHA